MAGFINSEESVRKTVGRKTSIPDPLSYVSGLQRTLGAWNPPRIPKGVYRFHSHEEADRWLMDRLTRKPAN